MSSHSQGSVDTEDPSANENQPTKKIQELRATTATLLLQTAPMAGESASADAESYEHERSQQVIPRNELARCVGEVGTKLNP